ncbi:MAG: glycoside hydrolase [Verrucomicrobiae bacterium]|nr:glycoside hydrolase [Verrucomicrobiae bacterium]
MRLEADRVNGKRFYLMRKNPEKRHEVWVSEDGGASWSLPAGNAPFGGQEARHAFLVPFKNPVSGQGELWVSAGPNGIHRSLDGGRSFQRVAAGVVLNAYAMAAGLPKPGTQLPTLYVAGTLRLGGQEQDGVFASHDLGATWEAMTAPGRCPFTGQVNDMVADGREYGRLYLASNGFGVAMAVRK